MGTICVTTDIFSLTMLDEQEKYFNIILLLFITLTCNRTLRRRQWLRRACVSCRCQRRPWWPPGGRGSTSAASTTWNALVHWGIASTRACVQWADVAAPAASRPQWHPGHWRHKKQVKYVFAWPMPIIRQFPVSWTREKEIILNKSIQSFLELWAWTDSQTNRPTENQQR